jgi:hypothetical protein
VMQRALDKVFGFCLGELQNCDAELSGPPPGALGSPLVPLAPPGRKKR